jgi:hypothetical protein
MSSKFLRLGPNGLTMRVADVLLLKKLIAMLGLLAAGFAGGGFLGFALGYIVTGNEYRNPHGGLILVGLLTIGGAIVGLIVGAVTAYRVVGRAT